MRELSVCLPFLKPMAAWFYYGLVWDTATQGDQGGTCMDVKG